MSLAEIVVRGRLLYIVLFALLRLILKRQQGRTIQRLIHPPPLALVKNGQMLHRNMRQELITKEELLGQLREQGVEDVRQVKSAHIEGDGNISVVMMENVNA